MIDLAPDDFRQLGYRVIDLIAEQLATIREVPARRTFSGDLRSGIVEQPLPESPQEPADLLERAVEMVFPYTLGNNSPRFFGWVNSPAAPLGILGEVLASAMNSSVAGGDHAATYIEHATLRWLKALLGFPAVGGGILTSGGSVANLIGLAVMRHAKAGGRMVVYTSTEGHSCLRKAVELLGLGNENLRRIPVDREYRLDVDSLMSQIRADRDSGLSPVCVAATAGTVNTGAIDPLDAIANLCEAEGLWFHVDGSYGAPGILAEQTEGLYRGMERADSLAIDPHKWFYIPVECGCALVRDAAMMRETFSVVPPYLRDDAAVPWFSEFGIQQSRGFRALKLWLVLQQVGVRGYRELISRDIELARKLRERIQQRPDFELAAAGPLSITCFRYAPAGANDLNELNRRLLDTVQREGNVFLTSTELDGQFVLRACIINFRTREDDLDALLDAVEDAGLRVQQS